MNVILLFDQSTKQFPKAMMPYCLSQLVKVVSVLLVISLSTTPATSQDCQSEGLVCNNSLQISLRSDCTLGLDIDRFIENPLEGIDYQVEFFDEHSRSIDSITSQNINQQIEFKVSCDGNSCSGSFLLEANQLPAFNAPCQTQEGLPIPDNCQTWCGSDIPSVFLTLADIDLAIQDMCIPDIIGDIDEILLREGDICSPDGEIVTIIHEAKVLRHGTLQVVELLRQTVRQTKISIDPSLSDVEDIIIYPPTQFFDCDQGFSPSEIVEMTGSVSNGFPVYLDEHNLVPDSIFRCDTFILETILGLRDTVLPTDTIDGNIIWEQLTVVDKEFTDSISCSIMPLLNADSTVVLVPNEIPLDGGICNLGASFNDVIFDACANGQKVVRHWTIIDWCDALLEISDTQIIEVTDQQPPVILEPLTKVDVTLDPWSCQASALLPIINATDNCGNVTVVWTSSHGQVVDNVISNVSLDQSPIQLTAIVMDDCLNADSLIIDLNIIDDTPPVAICNTSTQIVLTGSNDEFDNGTAKIMAVDLDEGSNDPQCGKVEFFVVRQEDWLIPVENCAGEFIGYEPQSCFAKTEIVDLGESLKADQCEFNGNNRRPFVTQPAEFIEFCCEDVGKLIEVVFIARDEAGNMNECNLTILVTNENGPELICEDAIITCEDDIHAVPAPTLIDGSICPVSDLPLQIITESVNRTNCDSIVVSREWFVDADLDGTFSAGDPKCVQDITIVGAPVLGSGGGQDNIELICEDFELPCTTPLDEIPRPGIDGNIFCVCDTSLIKILDTQLTNNLCTQDTLTVQWFFDRNDDGELDPFESRCTQNIALVTNPDMFEILCMPDTISCNQTVADATRPTVAGATEACLCPEEFLATEFVEQIVGNCSQESFQRSWFIDANQNNRRDDDEESCLQDIFIDFSSVSFSLQCRDTMIQCGQDPSLFFTDPVVTQTGDCSCDAPPVVFLEEVSELNPCGIDRFTRTFFLDTNENGNFDLDEESCDQVITINNMVQTIGLACENTTVTCLDQLESFFIPTIINENTCGCTSPQLELRAPIDLDGVCFGDVITREWFVDLDGDEMFDDNEPFCIQELSLILDQDAPQANQAMAFDCGPVISASCTDDLNAIAAPTLQTNGFCDCGDIDIVLQSESPSDGVCVGERLFRTWFADVNANGIADNSEPTCTQEIAIVGNVPANLICENQTINCGTSLDQLPIPSVENIGFCICDNLQVEFLSDTQPADLCFGDQFTRTYFIDLNEDSQLQNGEPTCTQSIQISNDNIVVEFENCDTVSVSCQENVNDFPPTVTAAQGICTCNNVFSVTLAANSPSEMICPGESVTREWFVDLNADGIQTAEEPSCTQTIVSDGVLPIGLICQNTTASCLDTNPEFLPPTIQDSLGCGTCIDVEVLLLSEFGAPNRFPGDTLFREWFGDVNGNSLFDNNEPSCLQEIIFFDENPIINFDCQALEVSCNDDITLLEAPALIVQSSCAGSNFTPILFEDGLLLDSLCPGDTTARMWFVDLDGDEFADENEPFCLQEITIVVSQIMDSEITSDTTFISCDTDLSTVLPTLTIETGICQCDQSIDLLPLDNVSDAFCVNDTIRRSFIVDTNSNGLLDGGEPILLQVLIVETTDESLSISCEDQFADCAVEDVPALLPIITSAEGCVCPDIQPLILSQFGAEQRCVGDTLFREWFADINANNNFDQGEPTCIQNVILIDDAATATLDCPQVMITCETLADSIPLPTIMSDSSCGCMNDVLTLISDGSQGGICFGESFTREWFLDMNSDGLVQDDEATCFQIISVAGTVTDMTFNCEPQIIACSDTLSQIPLPEINAIGICTCDQFELEIADVSIPSSICIGDTIIQTLFADTNPNNEFDTLDVFCEQFLIIEGTADVALVCDSLTVSCGQDLSSLALPLLTATGLCNCSDIDISLLSETSFTEMMCIGEELTRVWFADENGDGTFQDGEASCDQIVTVIGDAMSFDIVCDTIQVSCTDSISTIPFPVLTPLSTCVCDTVELMMIENTDFSLCPQDTTFRTFFGDVNGDGLLSDGEPSCSQVIIVDGVGDDAFDPVSIRWPASFTFSSNNGVVLNCVNDSIVETEQLLLDNEPMLCMPNGFEPRPFWCENECDLIGFTVASDTVFSISSCFTIENTFTVIDWCTFSNLETDSLDIDDDEFELVMDLAQNDCESCVIVEDTLYARYAEVDIDGFYQYTQEIQVMDDEPPVVTFMQDTVIVNVTPNDSTGICVGSVDVTGMAMDMCEGSETDPALIQWTIRVVDEERAPVFTEDGFNIETRSGGVATINSRDGMPGDTFSIIWTVRDACNAASIVETQVIFIDSLNQCDTTGAAISLIGGVVHTEIGEMVSGAQISLNSSLSTTPKLEMTSTTGNYMFRNNDLNADYQLAAYKEDHHATGVSTADIIRIYNHLSGQEPFESPYKSIAADVTNDKRISIEDIAELKKLIIGQQLVFKENEAWRFVSDLDDFFDVSNPWPFVENMTIRNLSDNLYDRDFTAVKIGDVTDDALTNVESRHQQIVRLSVTDKWVEKGEAFEMTIHTNSAFDIFGMQGTIMMDNVNVELIGDRFAINNSEYFNNTNHNTNTLSYSFHEIQNKKTEFLFTVKGLSAKEGFLSDFFEFNDLITKTEVYGNDGKPFGLEFIFVSENPSFTAGNFTPNPFAETTYLDVQIPDAGLLQYSIYAADGRRVKLTQLELNAGLHKLEIHNDDLLREGLYTVLLEYNGQKRIKRLVLVN